MKILTTVKRIVDPEAKVRLKPDGSGMATDGIDCKVNTFDEYGVEEAIRLKEKHGGEVVVVSVGSSDASKELRTALAMGADRAILVEADLSKLDNGVVARLIAAVAEREQPDVIVMGKLSVDSEENQVAQRVAGHLGWPQATFAFKVEIGGGWATVGREVDGGTSTVRVKLPAVITADLRLNEPRYASLPGIRAAKNKPLETLAAASLGVDLERRLKATRYELPPARKAGEVVADVDELVDRLQNEARVI